MSIISVPEKDNLYIWLACVHWSMMSFGSG